MKYFFGVDLGGTTAKLAVVNHRNKIINEASLATAGSPNPKKLAGNIGLIFKRMTGDLGPSRPRRIGVGVAGDIDSDRGIVRVSPNLGWKNVPLGQMLKSATGVPVTVDNDANAAAWGIYQTQVRSGVKNILAVTLGTGVGGGMVIDGKLFRGATGSAGEVGHMILVEHGRRCRCGLQGCLETYAGGAHLVSMAKDALRLGKKSKLSHLFNENPNKISPQAIAEAAQLGDKLALFLLNQMGHMLGLALGNLVYVLNPEKIFLTGGVSQAKNLILKPLLATLKKRPFKTPLNAVQVQIAKEPARMGVIGASLL